MKLFAFCSDDDLYLQATGEVLKDTLLAPLPIILFRFSNASCTILIVTRQSDYGTYTKGRF